MKDTKKLAKQFLIYDSNPDKALKALKDIPDFAKTAHDFCEEIIDCLKKTIKRNSENIDRCYKDLENMKLVAQQELGKDISFEQKVFWFKQMKSIYEQSINLYRIEKRDNLKLILVIVATSILSIGISAILMGLTGTMNVPSKNNAA